MIVSTYDLRELHRSRRLLAGAMTGLVLCAQIPLSSDAQSAPKDWAAHDATHRYVEEREVLAFANVALDKEIATTLRVRAIWNLGKSGNDMARGTVLALLRDERESTAVQRAAVVAMSALVDEQGVGELMDLLLHHDARVAIQARDQLIKLTGIDPAAGPFPRERLSDMRMQIYQRWRNWWSENRDCVELNHRATLLLARKDVRVVADINPSEGFAGPADEDDQSESSVQVFKPSIDETKSENLYHQRTLTVAEQWYLDYCITAVLGFKEDEEYPQIRPYQAAMRLGWIGHQDAIPALIAALQDRENSSDLRIRAVKGLSAILDRRIVPVLIHTVLDPQPDVARQAHEQLIKITEVGIGSGEWDARPETAKRVHDKWLKWWVANKESAPLTRKHVFSWDPGGFRMRSEEDTP